MDLQAAPYILTLGFLFGSTLIASRFGVGQFSPTTYIWLRLLIASLGHAGVYALGIQGRRWPKDGQLWARAAFYALIGTAIPMTAIVSSLQYQSSGVTSVLLTANPAITVVMAHFILDDERLTVQKIAGVVLALGGALLLALRGESGLPGVTAASPIGYGLVFAAMIFGSSATVYARKYLRGFDAVEVASVRMLIATLIVMPLSLIFVGFDLGRVDAQGYLALGYAALVGTFLGMLLQFYTIKRFGATAAVLSLYVIPVFAGIGGVFLLGETITTGMLAGMALIAGGIALITRA